MAADIIDTEITEDTLRALLSWYADMGVDECVSADPVNYFEAFPQTSPPNTPPPPQTRASRPSSKPALKQRPTTGVIRPDANAPTAEEAASQARELAISAKDIPSLEAIIRGFDGCPLKKGARHTVFADGKAGAPLMVIGEAPGRDEDREGKPFVGRAGLLLDRMLAAIGHSREENAYISNVIYWRPPGNRTPTPEEMLICQPFAERLIELAQPKTLMIAGAAPLKALLNKTGITKTRGNWQTLNTTSGFTVPVMPTFHPAYLLRNPQTKRLVWQDLQALAAKLREN